MTEKEEAAAILALCSDDMARSLQILEGQLTVIHNRAQVLISLAGIVVTVTGFSGRIIASTSLTAQIAIIAGLGTVLTAAVFTFLQAMQIRWVTMELAAPSPLDTLERILLRRNRKTRAYAVGCRLLGAGLILYGFAVALMLLNPQN